jgi:hypothetical protein
MTEALRTSPLRRVIEIFAFLSLVLLSAQGVLNYVFAATPLVVWKQILIPAVFAAVLLIYRRRQDVTLSVVVAALGGVLAFYTVAAGNPTEAAIYNMFYYTGWVPFYLLGTSIDLQRNKHLITGAAFWMLTLGALGLLLQLFTSSLDFLKDTDASLYRSRFGETQRYAFVFVASTGVMPTLLGYYRLLAIDRAAVGSRIYGVATLALSGVPTGSLSSLIAFIAAVGATFVRLRSASRLGLVIAIVLAGGALVTYGGDLVAVQLERITGNGVESESNQERIDLWRQALEIIGGFSPEAHLVGLGLGTTNGNYFGDAHVVHGESTFFQAYIEGGVIGLGLRIMPFILLFTAAIKLPKKADDLFYGFALFACCAVAPIFGMFGLSCVLGFVAGIAVARARVLSPRKVAPMPIPEGVVA